MTKEEKLKAYEMWLDGKTFTEIGNKFGVTGEAVRVALTINERRKKDFVCIYPGLKKWIIEHNYSVSRFVRELDPSRTQTWIMHKFRSKTDFDVHEVKKVLAFTGLTFEEAFGEEAEPGGDANGEIRQ